MRVLSLWLQDFRNYATAELVPAPRLTVVQGANGEGKTNLLEALGWLATTTSFRGVPDEALVRAGSSTAILRCQLDQGNGGTGERRVLVEAELRPGARDRVHVNRQSLRRARDLLGIFQVSIFSPQDLVLVRGGPVERRRYLDGVLVACAPKRDALLTDMDRVLRQRNSLLKQQASSSNGRAGRTSPEVLATLDVWDRKLVELGQALGQARARLVERLRPFVAEGCTAVAGRPADVGVTYEAPWRAGGLAAGLAAARDDDLRRGVTTTGPHRDELDLVLDGMPVRTHGSQGEQRTMALALRLAAHRLVTEVTGTTPVLLLDDVFSELDPERSACLLGALPSGQILLTTAGPLPPGAAPELVLRVRRGRLLAAA